LSEADSHASGWPTPTRDVPTQEFEIGDLVQTKNPKPFQAKKGVVTKIGIGGNGVAVQAKNESKIVRAPSNLIPIN
jgi:hypothetical protein